MRLHGESGQTASEYIMLVGLLTAIAIVVLGIIDVPVRSAIANVVFVVVGVLLDPPF